MGTPEPTLGERLRAARLAAGRSQSDVSQASGVPKPTLSRYENDRVVPSVATLRRLASALGIPVSSLVAPPDDGEQLLVDALRRRGVLARDIHDAERLADLVADLIEDGKGAPG